MLAMQTLGISDSTARSDSRLKSLFWPSIESAVDVEYLAVQGYWVCTFVAAVTFLLFLATHQPVLAIVIASFFYLGGVGVREHNRFAATVVLVFYLIDTFASLNALVGSPGFIVLRAVIMALLLSNLRATWISAQWKADSEEAAVPLRLDDTLSDKFANKWPSWLWPKIRIVYYVYSIGILLLVGLGLAAVALHLPRG